MHPAPRETAPRYQSGAGLSTKRTLESARGWALLAAAWAVLAPVPGAANPPASSLAPRVRVHLKAARTASEPAADEVVVQAGIELSWNFGRPRLRGEGRRGSQRGAGWSPVAEDTCPAPASCREGLAESPGDVPPDGGVDPPDLDAADP